MKILRAMWVVLPALALAGCGTNDAGQEPPRLEPGNAVMATPNNYEPTTEDLGKVIDLPPYPGAKLAAQEKLNDKSISPDEHRYRVTLSTPDPISKVQAYYEKALGQKGNAAAGQASVFGHSARGSDYKIVITTEGGQTKIVETAITYRH